MNRQETLSILGQYGISPTRSLGQNFLTDDRVIDRIADIAGVGAGDLVIEIGPGIGGLTRILAGRAGKVIAIEIDRHVLPALQAVLAFTDNCSILHMDALRTDLAALAAGWPGPVKVVANLPYYITTPLIVKALVELPACSHMVLMIQKEAAARVMALPGSKQYGPLAVLSACFGETSRELIVPAGAFYPKPGVDSCVIRMIKTEKLQIDAWPAFLDFLERCFAQRRKMLVNSLRIAGTDEAILASLPDLLEKLQLGADIRAEKLAPDQFVMLYNLIDSL